MDGVESEKDAVERTPGFELIETGVWGFSGDGQCANITRGVARTGTAAASSATGRANRVSLYSRKLVSYVLISVLQSSQSGTEQTRQTPVERLRLLVLTGGCSHI